MWVIAVLAGLAALITFLLCVPIDLVFRTKIEGKIKSSVRLVWLFGLVSKDCIQTKKKPEESNIEQEQKSSDWTQGIRITLEVIRIKGLPGQLVRLIKRILRHIRVRELVANLKLGLDNPADTGLLFAFAAPFNLLLSHLSPHRIRIEPSFASDTLIEGRLYGTVRLRPVQLAVPLLGFAFSFPTLRAVKKLVLYKWKRKR